MARGLIGVGRVGAALALLLGAVVGHGLAEASQRSGAEASAYKVYDPETALQISQAAIGRRLGDYGFRDSARRPVRLSQFRGKPLVINLVYTSCSYSCPLVVQTLRDAVDAARDVLPEDSFNVVTIGFDTRADTPERMRAFAGRQGVRDSNWRFLSGDRDTVDALTRDVGFVFFPSAKGFDHLAQTTVVDPEGIVYRQIYGADFEPPLLVEALKDLVLGRRSALTSLDGVLNRIRLFCTVYDPAAQRYRFDYSVIIATVAGATSLTGIGIVLVRAWLRTRRSTRPT